MYHDILENSADSGFHAFSAVPYKLDLAQFVSHMEIIVRAQAKPILVSGLPIGPEFELPSVDVRRRWKNPP